MILGKIKKVHFIGIGGIGMSGISELLLNLGFKVSGSDIKITPITSQLSKKGAIITAADYELALKKASHVGLIEYRFL